MQVYLNVYDVTNTASESTNGMISRLNSITRELALGGVFHGAIELDGVEWSFGYCETGTGVYACQARSNGMYTFRETIELGVTHKTRQEIKDITTRLKREWQGPSYDLLQRNCCHFCEELCSALGVPNPPAWLNRFAQGADATVKFTNEASAWFKRLSSNVSLTAQQNAQWLREMLLSSQGEAGRTPSQAALDAADGRPHNPDSQPSQAQAHVPNPLHARAHGGGAADEVGPQEDRYGTPSPRTYAPASSASSSVAWRLASRLPVFTGGGGSAVGPSGLPASTTASEPDSPSRLASMRGAAQAHTARLTSAVRQKLQELEATAGDGTKQFLFGMIKTRQARLEEDEATGLVGLLDDGTSGTGTSSLSNRDASAPAAALAAPTQPPVPQVISHSLLPPEMAVTGSASGASIHKAVPGIPAGSGPHLLDL